MRCGQQCWFPVYGDQVAALFGAPMHRLALLAFAAAFINSSATTLQQLSLNQMIQQSTAIVRGRPQQTFTAMKGSVIYTHYTIQVSESWKGAATGALDVAVPGGAINGLRQTYSGAPSLSALQDYVFFLWSSKTGLCQVIGLSQGLFTIVSTPSGLYATRAAATESMVDGQGNPVNDSNLSMPLADLKARVQTVATTGVAR